MAGLTSTDEVFIDLVAMRNWHFKASMDRARPPELRRWHRSQVDAISKRLGKHPKSTHDLVKLALIEVLGDVYRKKLFETAGRLAPFNWSRFCDAARAALGKKPIR
jgi:hypothetical protein